MLSTGTRFVGELKTMEQKRWCDCEGGALMLHHIAVSTYQGMWWAVSMIFCHAAPLCESDKNGKGIPPIY